ncbi:hypothetical protein [Caproiciproducens galactitolivorans]|uniref:Uncharacterized protein n=1 Tax=Caproiciproducens galactitolivorans TaxID=642589 RepID=A0ABT4BR99_9FIRM|nr:hypothetical protein [Caproiciproducens galactitolivorans]MCY1713419.1 hypothetical protein [Caproiciproducens galactitolivorans]
MNLYFLERMLNDDFMSEDNSKQTHSAIILTMTEEGSDGKEEIFDEFITRYIRFFTKKFILMGAQYSVHADGSDVRKIQSFADAIYGGKDYLYYYQTQNTDLLKYFFTEACSKVFNETEMLIYEKGNKIDQAFLDTDYEEKKRNPRLLAQALLTGDGEDLAILFRNKVVEIKETVLAAVRNIAAQMDLTIEKLD